MADWLARITPWYQAQVDAGAFPGAVVAIARQGRLAYLRAIGTQDRAGKVALKPDAIFWIASMTKPVTAVAALILADEGKLDLAAPVAKYIPELQNMRVGLEETDPASGKPVLKLVAAKRPMTVMDLLRQTSGLVYPEEGTSEVHRLYRSVPFRRDKDTPGEFIAALAGMPLAHQPGEVWEYGWSYDVLARVIEVASGQRFDAFLEARLFGPLGMTDTAFYVPQSKFARLVDPAAGGRSWDVGKPPKLLSGGGGLFSTAPDYLRFCQMLLNGGELDGVRVVSRRAVEQMTGDALGPNMSFAGSVGGAMGPAVGATYGLGVAIRSNAEFSVVPGSIGSYTWSGAWGTYFWIDPAENLVAIQMIQVEPSANAAQYARALRHLAYAALTPGQAPAAGPREPVHVGAGTLASYAGKYDFGPSLSARDRQAPLPAFAGLGMDVAVVEGRSTVRMVYDSMPAANAGVHAGDVVTEIEDQSLGGSTMAQVVDTLRGQTGTRVRVRIARKGEDKPIDLSLVHGPMRAPGAEIVVWVVNGELAVEATGPWSVLDFHKDRLLHLQPITSTLFRLAGERETRLAFVKDAAGKVTGVILNPGSGSIEGTKVP